MLYEERIDRLERKLVHYEQERMRLQNQIWAQQWRIDRLLEHLGLTEHSIQRTELRQKGEPEISQPAPKPAPKPKPVPCASLAPQVLPEDDNCTK